MITLKFYDKEEHCCAIHDVPGNALNQDVMDLAQFYFASDGSVDIHSDGARMYGHIKHTDEFTRKFARTKAGIKEN